MIDGKESNTLFKYRYVNLYNQTAVNIVLVLFPLDDSYFERISYPNLTWLLGPVEKHTPVVKPIRL